MQFFYPTFLWGLLLVAIPIILHFFNFRRHKLIEFSNIGFLKEIKQDLQIRNKIKEYLLLLTKILAIAAMVIAFAKPYIPFNKNRQSGANDVSIFIDNSMSMNSEHQGVRLLQKAKDIAREIIKAHQDEDKFQIVVHDIQGKNLRMYHKDIALGIVEEVESTFESKSVDNIISLQAKILNRSGGKNKFIYYISDMQKSSPLAQISNSSDIKLRFVPLKGSEVQNLTIDSIWSNAPIVVGQVAKFLYRVSNMSALDRSDVQIEAIVNGEKIVKVLSNISGRSIIIDTLIMRSNSQATWQTASIRVLDEPINFDNTIYFSFPLIQKIKILSIYNESPNEYFDKLGKSIAQFEITQMFRNQINYENLGDYDLVILDGLQNITSGLSIELQKSLDNGGNVLVFPHQNTDLAGYDGIWSKYHLGNIEQMNIQDDYVSNINIESQIFEQVYQGTRKNLNLPIIKKALFPKINPNAAFEILLSTRSGKAFLTEFNLPNGKIYYCASPIGEEYSNFQNNGEIFIPFIYKAAINKSNQYLLNIEIGEQSQMPLYRPYNGEVSQLRLQNENTEFIPAIESHDSKQYLIVSNDIKKPGHFELKKENDVLQVFSFNASKNESLLHYFTQDDLQAVFLSKIEWIEDMDFKKISNFISMELHGKSLWKYFVIAAILFLIFEALIYRFWK